MSEMRYFGMASMDKDGVGIAFEPLNAESLVGLLLPTVKLVAGDRAYKLEANERSGALTLNGQTLYDKEEIACRHWQNEDGFAKARIAKILDT